MIRPGSLVLSLLVFTAWGRGLHAAPDEVAFQPAGKLILVTGKINDQGAHNLILDTGATHTVITPPTAEALGLTTYPVGNGQKAALNTSITIGTATASGLTVYVFDPLQAVSLRLDNGINYHGIIGADFLSQFVTTIDYRRNRLSFEPAPDASSPTHTPKAASTNDASIRVPFEIVNNLIQAKGTINGRGPLTFLVDTGAAETVITPRAAKALNLKGQSSATQPGVWFVTLEKIAAGKAAMERVPAIIHMPAQENPHSVPYHAILGHSYLSRFKVTINYRAKVLLLEPNDSSPP
jgi:predicted aspartyl protease